MNSKSLTQSASPLATWYKFLSRWSLFTAIAYSGLVAGMLLIVIPAAQKSPLPAEYFELFAAGQEPNLYRLIIAFDVIVYLALGGLFAVFAALLRPHAPIRSSYIALLGSGMFVGFIGACLRIAGTTQFAAQYMAASTQHQAAIIQSYDNLLRMINITFSAVGLLEGLALLLIASAGQYFLKLPRWSAILIGLSGFLAIVKGFFELALGIDLGPLALLSGIILVIVLFSFTIRYWKDASVQ